MSPVYIYRGKKFVWRALVEPHLIEPEDKCNRCGGTGKLGPFSMMFSEPGETDTCPECNGRKTKTWHGPMGDFEAGKYLQKYLDEYMVDKDKRIEQSFIGAYI